MTLSVPEELYKLMKQHPEVRWSVVAREALWAYVRRLDVMERIASKSKLTEEDVEDLGRTVKRSLARRYEAEA